MTFDLSKEDLEIVYNFITLPFVIISVQKSLDTLKTTQHFLNKLYIPATEILLKNINTDLHKAKVLLSKSNINVVESERTSIELSYKVAFKGEESIICIHRDSLKLSIGKRLGYYTNSLAPEMK